MQPEEFKKNCQRTKSEEFFYNSVHPDLLHAAIGITTEAGELMDTVKKPFFYGAEFDQVNFEEELGDLLWYIAIACDRLDITFEEIMEKNIQKLKTRFPMKFSKYDALHRDVSSERKVLEKNADELFRTA